MPITTISRDTPNNVSVVRIATSDTLAQVGAANYITSQTTIINGLNKGPWGWFISDTLLVSAEDGNALYEFTDETFSSLILLGGVTSGTVSPGLINQVAVYPANGNTVHGVSTLPSLVQVNPANLNNGTGATANTFYAGNGTWKTVAAVTAHSIYTVYVAKDGNNTTGNGSINAPYATVAFAMGTITTASAANPFNIVVLGSTLAETVQIQLKPFVSITGIGESVVLNLSSDMILHSSWNTAVLPTSFLSNFSFTTSNINFDGTALTNATTALIFISGVQGIGRNFTVKGSANFDLQAYLNDCIFSLFLYSNAFVQLNDCITSVTCNLGKADAALRSSTGFFLGGRLGTVTINSLASGPGSQANFWGNQIQTLTADGAVASLFIDASSFIDSPLSILNSASYALSSKSDGVDANYTPVNYTPSATLPLLSTSVQGHLRGIDNKLGTILPGTYTNVFVYVSSTNGIDSVGRGGALNPYATITFATAQITDATASKQYTILCYGVFTETSLKIKSYVKVVGNGSSLTCTNPVNLDATFASSGSAWIEGFGALTGNISLDFTSLGTPSLYIANNQVANPTWTITGPSTLFMVANISNNISAIAAIALTITNSLSTIKGNSLGATTLSQTNSAASNAAANLVGNIHSGVLTVSTTGTKAMSVNYEGLTTSSLALSTASSGIASLTGVGCAGFGAISLSGTFPLLRPDLLSVTPTFSAGASDSGNIIYKPLAASLVAGFTPTNYTASNTRVLAHLQGIDTKLGALSPSSNSYVYVYVTSTGGADAVGNGSILKPYATISYAISQITDNSITKRYMILCYGNITETTLSLKPWVLVQGNSSSLAVTTINLDASFSGTTNALCYIDNFTGLTGAVTLDFTGATTPRLVITNLRPSAAVTWTITGPATGSLNGIISRNFGGIGFTTPIDLTIANFDGEIVNNCLRTTTLTASGAAATHSIFFGNNIVVSAGAFTVSSTSVANIVVNSNSAFQSVPLSLTNTSTGTASLTCMGSDGFSAVTITGTLTTFKPDLLSVTPTFASGATDTVNIVYGSLAASVTAGFSPTNYTAANTRVLAHLQGIDTQLGVISPATNSFIYRYVSSTGGTDAVGNGSILKPYATISYALTQITDNTSAKRYIIYCNGVFTETTLTMKPWVLLEGNGSFLTADTWALDAAFTTANALFYVNNFILAASGAASNMTISFASGTTPRVVVTNLKLIVRFTLNVSGPTTGNANVVVSNNSQLLLSGNFMDLTLNNCTGVANNSVIRNLVLSSSNASGAHSINTAGNIVGVSGGAFSCTTTGTGTIAVISNDIYTGIALTLTSNTGTATLRANGCDGFNAITISNAGAVLTPDLLSVTPAFGGAAVDGTNCVYPSLAASVTAGFSPANYTAANTRVRSHLEGIDAQLANFNVGNKSLGTTTNDNATALHVGEYVSSSVLVAGQVALTTATPANVTSISLTAGDWMVSASAIFNPNALTTTSSLQMGISQVSATLPTLGAQNNSSLTTQTFAAGLTQSLSAGEMRISLSATTTIYFVAQAAFAVNAMNVYGFIGARRAR